MIINIYWNAALHSNDQLVDVLESLNNRIAAWLEQYPMGALILAGDLNADCDLGQLDIAWTLTSINPNSAAASSKRERGSLWMDFASSWGLQPMYNTSPAWKARGLSSILDYIIVSNHFLLAVI